MQTKKYFESVIKFRNEKNLIKNELAKREVDTIFFLIKNFFNKEFKNDKFTVVEIGCGDGYLKTFFEKKGFKYIGYDIQDLDIEKDKIDLEDGSVDLVVNIGLIEALRNIDNLYSESKRILKKDGFFYTLTPNWKKDYKNFYDNPIHKTPLTPKALTQSLLDVYKFKEVKVFPGLRCKPKWYYSGRYCFEKAFYLLPFNQYTHIKEKSLYTRSFLRSLIPEFLKGHSRSIIAIAKK